ncbi:uncharacterized protein IUM83_02834 [Phytophthora cinnamomi]|uniref:uncharacterized protein n=1 Tax=Phytophthora cinnamomi TaxID=4785 RepID=UPI00355A5D29|nr:hypothetical protein IUM83_02834 [Phytophthora cinnamomi]
MSSSQALLVNARDFPRVNGTNFVIWKTRVTAALDGNTFFGFATQPDYAEGCDIDLGPDENLDPALAEQHDAPKPGSQQDSSSSEASDVRMVPLESTAVWTWNKR